MTCERSRMPDYGALLDIVERLRATHHTAPASEDWRLCYEAADEIERLRAELDRWRTARCQCITSQVEGGVWTCGCGIINGVNLAACRVCGRKEGER